MHHQHDTKKQTVSYLDQDQLTLSWDRRYISGTIDLTGSKSESNRALLLQALSKDAVQIDQLSEADDTRLMRQSLQAVAQQRTGTQVIDVGPAGTVMRFMTAYLAISPGKYILQGSTRMHERPIGVLVDALQELGAQIDFRSRQGYPPLFISGGFEQTTNQISVPGNISSQYLSALLLIAPILPQGLQLRIEGELTSRPYVEMTLEMLSRVGIRYSWTDDTISIPNQSFKPATLSIEPDWSAASYWYSLLALAEAGELNLSGLKESSLQGDRQIVSIMEHFGVYSSFTAEGVRLRKGIPTENPSDEILDFTNCPDIAQTVIACAAALGRQGMRFSGLHTLRIKETDRIQAMQNEIAKFGTQLITDDDIFHLKTSESPPPRELVFDTYEDHRMAMAFAPLSMKLGPIKINNPGVVNKSYPKFWVHLRAMGCSLANN